MAEPRNETQLTARIVAAIEREYPSAWVLKVHGNGYQRVGIPDLLVCVAGRLVGLEVKHQKPGESVEHLLGRVRAVQAAEIDKLRRAGATAAVVWTVEQALAEVAQVAE